MRNFRLGEWLPEAMTPLFAELWPRGRHSGNRLSMAQRVDYLLGGLQWLNDLVQLGFTVVLLATVALLATTGRLALRPLLGVAVLLPATLLTSGLVRALWPCAEAPASGPAGRCWRSPTGCRCRGRWRWRASRRLLGADQGHQARGHGTGQQPARPAGAVASWAWPIRLTIPAPAAVIASVMGRWLITQFASARRSALGSRRPTRSK
jgi:hypothetical protein